MRGPRALSAALAVVVLVGSQLAALAHTAAVRHVVCEEHGEQIEAPALIGSVDDCPQTHLVGVAGGDGDHEDCPIARLLRSSLDPLRRVPVIDLATVVSDVTGPPATHIITARDLVLIAPKTSPPVAR